MKLKKRMSDILILGFITRHTTSIIGNIGATTITIPERYFHIRFR